MSLLEPSSSAGSSPPGSNTKSLEQYRMLIINKSTISRPQTPNCGQILSSRTTMAISYSSSLKDWKHQNKRLLTANLTILNDFDTSSWHHRVLLNNCIIQEHRCRNRLKDVKWSCSSMIMPKVPRSSNGGVRYRKNTPTVEGPSSFKELESNLHPKSSQTIKKLQQHSRQQMTKRRFSAFPMGWVYSQC